MKALLLHDIVPDDAAAEALLAAGHQVVRCSPVGAATFPCVGEHGDCPLDGTVDVAVVVHDRPTNDFAAAEVGAICARRDDVPIVLAGNGTHSPIQAIATAVAPSIRDVVPACERAIATREARLGRIVGGHVRLSGGRVHATLPAWATAADVVRAHQQLTTEVPNAASIDIAVTPS